VKKQVEIPDVTKNSNNFFVNFLWTFTLCVEKSYDGIAPRLWRDFGSALLFQTRLTQTEPVLPLSKEHGSQVKDQCRRQCCHNKHNKFPYRPTFDVSLLSGRASYLKLIMLFIIQKRAAVTGGRGRESCTVRSFMFCIPHLMSRRMRWAGNVARME
jgi:hypothetical protein